MPLQKGSSRPVISGNIREMVEAGHPLKQALAASMRMAGKKKPEQESKRHEKMGGNGCK